MKKNGIFYSDIKRIALSPVFWSAIVINIACMAVNLFNWKDFLGQYRTVGTLNLFFYGAVYAAGGLMAPIAPILPVLAFGTSIFDDMESGYLRQILTRMKKSTYLMQRVLSIAISGGGVFAISMTIFWIFLPLIDSAKSPMIDVGPIQAAFGSIYGYSMLAYFVFYIFAVTLFGALQALLSTGVSLLAQNRYVGLIVPAIIFHGGRLFYGLTGYRFSFVPWYSYAISIKETSGAVYYEFAFYLVICAATIMLGWNRAKKSGRI